MFTHETKNLVGYIEGGLPPEAQSRIERHLETCHHCRAELANMRAARRALEAVGHGTPAPAYDSELWSRVHAQIARPHPAPRLRPRWALATGAFALAATTVCLVMVLDRTGTAPDGMLTSRPEAVVTKGKPAARPDSGLASKPSRAWDGTVSAAQGTKPSLVGAPPMPAAPPIRERAEPVRMAAAPPDERPASSSIFAAGPDSRIQNAPSPPPERYEAFARRESSSGHASEKKAAPTVSARPRGFGGYYKYENLAKPEVNFKTAPPSAPAPAPAFGAGIAAADEPAPKTMMAELGLDTSAVGGSHPLARGAPLHDNTVAGAPASRSAEALEPLTSLGTTVKPKGTSWEAGIAPEIVPGPPPDYASRALTPVTERLEASGRLKLEWDAPAAQHKARVAQAPPNKATAAVALRPPTEAGRRLYAEASADLGRGRTGEAIVGFRKALDAGVTLTEARVAHLRLGDAAVKAKDDATALKEYTTAVEIAKDAEALSKLGGVYERMGNAEKAANAYEQALLLNPGHIESRAALARLKSRKP